MISSLINKYLTRPDRLDSESLKKLESWMESYPFFQTARLLHVKNLQNLEGQVKKEMLNLTAAYVTDRKVLYYLLHKLSAQESEISAENQETESVRYSKEIKDTMVENIAETITRQRFIYDLEPDREIELIPGLAIDIRKEYGENIELENRNFSLHSYLNKPREEFFELSGNESQKTEQTLTEKNTAQTEYPVSFTKNVDESIEFILEENELTDNKVNIEPEKIKPESPTKEKYHGNESRPFTEWLDELNETKSIVSKDKSEEKQPSDASLTESGSELPKENEESTSSSLIEKFILTNPKIVPSNGPADHNDISVDSVKEHESFFTDTLAKIYIKQGHYAKAILAYEKLSLKYPEKSTYFAGQILEIKKLINNS